MTLPLTESRMVTSAEGVDFLCNLSPLLCAEELTTSSAEHRTGASLLGGRMDNKEYHRRWRAKNKDKVKKARDKYHQQYPWMRTLSKIKARCKGKYRKFGIKNFLTERNVQNLWWRDRAWLLKQPSIDRINSRGNYTPTNCRYIEHKDNLKTRTRQIVPCVNCGKKHKKYPCEIKNSIRLFCCRRCGVIWRTGKSIKEWQSKPKEQPK